MKHIVVLLCLASVAVHAQQRRGPQFGDPLGGLDASAGQRFLEGKEEFAQIETIDDGLGPVFNGRSCGECHNVPAIGGGSVRTVTRIGARSNGRFDPLVQFGGSLLQSQALGFADGSSHEFRPELVPPAATIVARRRSTPLFGLGLVDATPDTTFIALAQQQALRRDGTAGRAAMVDNPAAGTRTVGKFGWKAQIATLVQFAGDAYLNEMGITSPAFAGENCPSGNCSELQFNPLPGINDGGEGVQSLADFMRLLAPPPRGPVDRNAQAGERIFERIGCAACHVAMLQTADRVVYRPYSDFLLHDMGTLGDGIEQGDATGREMRTAPLWGLRAVTRFLHDGRAATIEAAIGGHDGQARAARDRFLRLSPIDRARLLAFLRSL